MEEFPPNSAKSKTESKDEKRVERVTSGDPVRRKKPLGKQFHETFMGGNLRQAVNYSIGSVMIPAAKDMFVDAVSQGIERLIFGDSRRRGARSGPSGPLGYVSYNRMGADMRDPRTNPPAPNITRRGRAMQDFDEIVLQSRTEAEEVIDRMFDILSRFESVTVADLYELTGIKSNHVDQTWGWTDLHGAGVSRIRNGYLLDLPAPDTL